MPKSRPAARCGLALRIEAGYCKPMSLTEILEEIPKLSFAERQQLVRRAIEADEELSPHDEAVLGERLMNFRADPQDGVPAESLKEAVMQRLKPQ